MFPLICIISLSLIASTGATHIPGTVPYIAPAANGGSQLDSSAGLGEPLNLIISALSSASILESSAGLEKWAKSIDYSTECLGFHIGGPQTANLGDGRGWVNESAVIRYDYMNAGVGTCLESLTGGNHFRFWQQETTGAYFLAASYEEWAGEHHDIIPNGYDIGRNIIAKSANGTTSYEGTTYVTTVNWISGLLQPGSEGINHNIVIDGQVALLTIFASENKPGVHQHDVFQEILHK